MIMRSVSSVSMLASLAFWLAPCSLAGDDKALQPQLTGAEMEEFLRTAKVVKTKTIGKGITGTLRVTMTDEKGFTHDAHVQSIDVAKAEFKSDRGVELNFKDSYKFNIAAYKLGELLGIHNIPVSVERKVAGKTSAVTWWIDDVIMDEKARHTKKMDAPNPEDWNEQMYVVRVFDQLIYNMDRNLENLLIREGWRLEMIDHTRSFRLMKTLQNAKNLVKCDRTLLKNLRALDAEEAMKTLRPYCTKSEVESMLARRDLIVKFFDQEVASKGEGVVLYDLRKADAVQKAGTAQ